MKNSTINIYKDALELIPHLLANAKAGRITSEMVAKDAVNLVLELERIVTEIEDGETDFYPTDQHRDRQVKDGEAGNFFQYMPGFVLEKKWVSTSRGVEKWIPVPKDEIP